MILFHSVLFAMGVMVGLGGPTDPRGTIVRQELQIVNKKLPGAETDPRRDIHVFVEVSPVQPRVAAGICFVIDVGNEGSEPVELADITADGRIGLGVWNADGVPVDLPDHEGTTTSNPGGWARRHGLPEHVKAEMKERRPFAVMKPDLLPDDPKMKSIESIKDGKIRLEPGEHFQVCKSWLPRCWANRRSGRRKWKNAPESRLPVCRGRTRRRSPASTRVHISS